MGHQTERTIAKPPARASVHATARWAAAGLLGVISVAGMGWALTGRVPADPPPTPASIVSVAPRTFDPAAPGPYPALPARAARSEPGDATPVATSAPARTSPTASNPTASNSTNPPATTPPAAVPLRININTANRGELELLPRIGPTLAQRIIEFRETEGPIGSLTRLQDVKGIGERTAARLEPYIRFE